MGLIAYFSLDGVGVARGAGRKYLSQGIMGEFLFLSQCFQEVCWPRLKGGGEGVREVESRKQRPELDIHTHIHSHDLSLPPLPDIFMIIFRHTHTFTHIQRHYP